LTAALLGAFACRAGENMGGVGISAPRPVASSAAITDAGPDVASPVPADFRATMAKVAGKQTSHGHADRYEAIVWANDGARAVWDAAADMPDGAMLVEELSERVRGGAGETPAGLLAMQKSGGVWRFSAVSARGEVASDAQVAPCAKCHDSAPRDDVFRVPPPPPAPPASADAGAYKSSATTSAAMTAIAPTAVAMIAAAYDARSAGSAALPSSR
jgi:hypothetical protein